MNDTKKMIVVINKKMDHFIFFPTGIPSPLTDKEVIPPSFMKMTRRELPSGDAVIELAVYTDSLFTAMFPSKDVSKRIELMALKYNGVMKRKKENKNSLERNNEWTDLYRKMDG